MRYFQDRLDVSVCNASQLKAVREAGDDIARVYVHGENAAEYVERAGKTVSFAGKDYVLVRNLEQLGRLSEEGFEGGIIADSTLYAWNKEAVAFLKEAGATGWTLPLELHFKALKELAKGEEDVTLVVYGRAPMMVSANCVRKTEGKCSGSAGGGSGTACPSTGSGTAGGGSGSAKGMIVEEITDRTGRKLPVACHCSSCYNVIWNAVPTSLHNERDTIFKHFGNVRLRVDLTTETYEEARAVLGYYIALAKGDSDIAPFPFDEYTTGRFRKSVE